MGSVYTIQVWGQHFGERSYSYMVHWAGQSAFRAMVEFWRASRLGYGCVTLEYRRREVQP